MKKHKKVALPEMKPEPVILGIETSCDDTSAAVCSGALILSNVTASQKIHESFGGVVPELASRAHQRNILPVVQQALSAAGITKNQLDAIAYTRGPGLIGALLVGSSFAKGLSTALGIPLIEVHHMQAHVLANFARRRGDATREVPDFPFLCLTISGGHTQILRVDDFHRFEVLGETEDDAAGEAFDKIAKMIGLPYPGGPQLDHLAQDGNPDRFHFPEPRVKGLDFSFSGLKTSALYFLQKKRILEPGFPSTQNDRADFAASIQHRIVQSLLHKMEEAVQQTGIQQIALAGGVSANSGVRGAFLNKAGAGWKVFLPDFEFCTDNGGMIALTGYYRYQSGLFAGADSAPQARFPIGT